MSNRNSNAICGCRFHAPARRDARAAGTDIFGDFSLGPAGQGRGQPVLGLRRTVHLRRLAVGCAQRKCSIVDELRDKTWDQQRMSASPRGR